MRSRTLIIIGVLAILFHGVSLILSSIYEVRHDEIVAAKSIEIAEVNLEASKERCRNADDPYTCFGVLAVAERDLEICDISPAARINCLQRYARELHDSNACAAMPLSLEGPFHNYRDACYWEVAIKSKDPNLCDEMTGPESEEIASLCFSHLAYQLQDQTLCNEAGNLRSSCSENVAMRDQLSINTASCEGGMTDEYCLMEAAVGAKNSTLCDMLPDPNKRNTCLVRYGRAINDVNACDAMLTSINSSLSAGQKDQCYLTVATSTNDFNICNRMNSLEKDFYFDKCVTHFAQ